MSHGIYVDLLFISFQFDTSEKDLGTAVVIMAFDVISRAPLHCPVSNDRGSDELGMPLTDAADMKGCNCAKAKYGALMYALNKDGSVAQDTSGADLASDSAAATADPPLSEEDDSDFERQDDDQEEAVGEEDPEGPTGEYSITLPVKGSAFERFQPTLHLMREGLCQNQVVECRLVKEPTNARDKNAVLVEGKVNDDWQPIGYIGVTQLPRVCVALPHILDVRVLWIRRKYTLTLNKPYYTASICLTKKGPWLATKPNNSYNSDLFN